MKRFISISAAVALVAGASAAIEWSDAIPNLAQGSTVVAVSSNPGAMATITDGNDGTSWQATGGANKYADDWALIDLGESKTFTDVEIMWEASHPSAYSVYVTDEAPAYSEITYEEEKTCNAIDKAWLDAATPAFTSTIEGEAAATDNLSCAGVTGRYILVYCTAYNGWAGNYGSRIFEVRVADIVGRDEVGSLRVNAASVAEGGETTVKVDVLSKVGSTLSADKVENLTLSCSDPEAVEIASAGEGSFTVKGLRQGVYTLTATAVADGLTVRGEAQFKVDFNWDGKNIVVPGMNVIARVKAETEYPNAAANAVDGDKETYYEYNGDWGGGDSWVIIDLESEYMLDAVGALYGSNSGGRYKVGYAPQGAALPAEGEYDFVMADDTLEGWSWTSSESRANESLNTYVFAAPVKARYIAVRDADNPNGKPRVCEVYAAGVEYETSVPAAVEFSADRNLISSDETVTFSGKVFDQYGVEMPEEVITYKVDGVAIDGAEHTFETVGAYEIVAECGEAVSEPATIEVVAAAATRIAPNTTATFGGESHDGNPFAGVETQWVGDNLGKTLLVTFDRAYHISLIRLNWEAACPSDYIVEVIRFGEETPEKVFELSGRAFEGGFNPVDRIAHNSASQSSMLRVASAASADLSNVKAIAITPTATLGHNYPVRLFGVDAYGDEVPGTVTGIDEIAAGEDGVVNVYNLQGVLVRASVAASEATVGLPAGLYIAGGRKVVVK